MKKFLLLGLALVLLGSALFADDAKVMPARLGRFYFAPSFSFAPGAYDKDGKLQKFDDGAVKVFNLGFATEVGVTDWITAAIQFAPGVTVWSDVSPAAPTGITSLASLINPGLAGLETAEPFNGDLTVNGVADIFLGAKLQIVGETGPVKANSIRFAAAPGLAIPLPGPDFSDEVDNALKGDKAKFSKMDNHVFGAGGRFYFDYKINDKFFINLYNETLFYPVKRDLDKDGPNLAILRETILATAWDAGYWGAGGPGNPGVAEATGDGYRTSAKVLTDKLSGEVNYKYKLTFEIEPQFSTVLGGAFLFGAGLPINYVYTPEYKYTVDGIDDLLVGMASIAGGPLPINEKDVLEIAGFVGKASHSLTIKPNVSVMLLKTPIPLEFKLQYGLPLYGQNNQAMHNVVFQFKLYFPLPGFQR